MGVLICLRESGLVGMGAMFGGDVIQSRFLDFEGIEQMIRNKPRLKKLDLNN